MSFETGLAAIRGPHLGWWVGFVDFDNNGWLDLFVANGHTYEKSSRGSAFGDYDNDGDLDIVINELYDQPTLLRNDTTGGHWINAAARGRRQGLTTGPERRGTVGARSNRDAIGAKVTIVAAGRRQVAEVRSGGSYVSHNDMRVHFGLDETTRIERVEIRWPNGDTEAITGLQADRFYLAREGQGAIPEP